MTENLLKFDHQGLTAIYDELDLNPQLAEQVKTYTNELQALHCLLEHQQFDAAIHLLAFGLPIREAIWWAYVCIEEFESQKDDILVQNCLKSISRFVHEPSEDARYHAEACADALSLYSASSWAAMAVFYSGDNIAPADKPAVVPTEFMAGQAVANAIIINASAAPCRNTYLRHCIKSGLHIAMGGNGKI